MKAYASNVIDEVKRERDEVKTDRVSMTWKEIINRFKEEELIINPQFQRYFRWDAEQQTQFVESILLGLPVPPLFFVQNDSAVHEVIDGLQRISTVLRFFSENIYDEAERVSEGKQGVNNLKQPAVLTEGSLIKSLDGYSASNFPETLLRTITNERIDVIIITQESSRKTRYEVFRRLNKYGVKLTDQEIRNCVARLYGSDFPDVLRVLGKDKDVTKALKLRHDKAQKMHAEELILRMLAFSFNTKDLKHDISLFLDDFMYKTSSNKIALDDDHIERVKKVFNLIATAYPDGSAFRLYNHEKKKVQGAFSSNLYDVVAAGVYKNLENLTAAKFKTLHSRLVKGDDITQFIGSGSNTRAKLQGRVKLGQNWFAE